MKHKQAATHQRKHAGDTIVEVIIVIAVISVILTGAFLVVSRSARAVRDSEEHAQAVQYLQSQLELLRNAASRSGGLPSALNIAFCLDTTKFYQPASNFQPPSSQTNCQMASLYNVSIALSRNVVPGPTTTFDLAATWPKLSGGTDTVRLSYRVVVTP